MEEPYRACRHRSLRGHRRLTCKGSHETGNGDRANGGDKGAFQPRHRDLLGFYGHPMMSDLPPSSGGKSAHARGIEWIDDQVGNGWERSPSALGWRVNPEPDRTVGAQLALWRGSHGYWAGNDGREHGQNDRASGGDEGAFQPRHRELPGLSGPSYRSSRPARGRFMPAAAFCRGATHVTRLPGSQSSNLGHWD